MATYVLLMNWRAEGAAATPLAALGHLGLSPAGGEGSVFETRKSIVETALGAVEGGKLCNLLWTLGETDMVAVVEAADNEQIGGFALYLNQAHNVRTETLPAFEPSTMDLIAQVAARCGTTTAAALGPAGS
jgi:uncharacterized protein with GYD domain